MKDPNNVTQNLSEGALSERTKHMNQLVGEDEAVEGRIEEEGLPGEWRHGNYFSDELLVARHAVTTTTTIATAAITTLVLILTIIAILFVQTEH